MPNLAQQYINTHLNLSLVQSFLIPMMEYVSKEEMQKAIKQKDNQLNDKNKKIAEYRSFLLKEVTEKLNKLRNEFRVQINNIDIQNENSVKSFVLKVKEERKELNEDMQTLRNWHAKYKGNDWKYFSQKNSDGIYWYEIYEDIQKKMEKSRQNNEKGTIFSSILQSLKTVLSTNKARSWGVTEALDQNSFKNENYLLEMDRINYNIMPNYEFLRWRSLI